MVTKSDPMVVVYENRNDSGWKEVDRTEMVKDSLNPDFARYIKMEYHFEMHQMIRFDVYDVDTTPTSPLEDHDFVGSAEIPLSHIIAKRRCHYVEELTYKDKKGRGTISVFCEEDNGNDDIIE